MLKTHSLFALSVLALALLTSPALQADTLVVPSAQESAEGNWGNDWPFNFPHERGQRYQQVYDASQFPAYPIIISEIRFRPDATEGDAFSSTIPDIQINLSTTASAVAGLNSLYAGNVANDDTVVVPRGSLALSSSDTGTPTRDFDIVIALTTPFRYDPSLGNLLMDVRNYGGGVTTQLDAHVASGAPVGRVWGFYGDVNSVMAHSVQSIGLVTQFTYTPELSVQDAIEVVVDIRAGVNFNSNGTLPVAIYSGGGFDATTVDVSTVTIGDPELAHLWGGDRASLPTPVKSSTSGGNLTVWFDIPALVAANAFNVDSVYGVLVAKTDLGVLIWGVDGV